MLVSRLVVVGALALVAFDAAAAPGKPITLELKLPKKPAFARPEVGSLLTAGPIALELTDVRTGADPAVVGAQREKGNDLYFWRSATPVGPAVSKMAAEVLGVWSVRVAADAEVHLKLELASFYVTERSETFGSTYLGDVRLKAALVDRTGAPLWSGEVSGTSKRPGVDGRPAMANEALSGALRAALGNLVTSLKLESVPPSAREAVPPHAEIRIEGNSMATSPDALFVAISRLKAAGVTDEGLVEYVEAHRPSRPLSVDEILRWKDAGIPDAAIKAASR